MSNHIQDRLIWLECVDHRSNDIAILYGPYAWNFNDMTLFKDDVDALLSQVPLPEDDIYNAKQSLISRRNSDLVATAKDGTSLITLTVKHTYSKEVAEALKRLTATSTATVYLVEEHNVDMGSDFQVKSFDPNVPLLDGLHYRFSNDLPVFTRKADAVDCAKSKLMWESKGDQTVTDVGKLPAGGGWGGVSHEGGGGLRWIVRVKEIQVRKGDRKGYIRR